MPLAVIASMDGRALRTNSAGLRARAGRQGGHGVGGARELGRRWWWSWLADGWLGG